MEIENLLFENLSLFGAFVIFVASMGLLLLTVLFKRESNEKHKSGCYCLYRDGNVTYFLDNIAFTDFPMFFHWTKKSEELINKIYKDNTQDALRSSFLKQEHNKYVLSHTDFLKL